MKKEGKKRTGFLRLWILLPVFLLSLHALSVFASPADGKAGQSSSIPGGPEPVISGIIPEEVEYSYPSYSKMPGSSTSEISSGLERSYDGRKYQTSVKNQGGYGLCWTFGTYAALEAYLNKQGKGTNDFSELHMAYSTSCENGNLREGEYRTVSSGGNRGFAAAYLMRGTGLNGTVDEAAEPYLSTDQYPEPPAKDLDDLRTADKSYTVRNILYLNGSYLPNEQETAAIKQAVKSRGGVGASLFWSGGATALYNGGAEAYYNEETASYYFDGEETYTGGLATNHLVEIVGWDDDYAVTNFNTFKQPQNPGAWLVKNSWGKNWGDNGYFWVSYEDHNFPVNSFCFDGAEEFDPAGTVYEYDFRDSTTIINYTYAKQVYVAKVFTAAHDGEILDSVKVFVSGSDMTLGAAAVTGFEDKTDFLDLQFAEEDMVSADYPGWYTIDLPEPLMIEEKGTQFAVVVKYKLDVAGPLYISTTDGNMEEGTAFLGTSLTGLSVSSSNFMLKAVTTMAADAAGRAAKEDLIWDRIRGKNEQIDAVRHDLFLPGTLYGIPVKWRSSDPSCIERDGTVQRGEADREVLLTATIGSGDSVTKKQFSVTVKGIPEADRTAVLQTADALWDIIKKDNASMDEVTGDLNLAVSHENTAIRWEISDPERIDPDGTVSRPSIAALDNGNVKLTATVTFGETEEVRELSLFLPYTDEETVSDRDRVNAAAEWMRKPYSDGSATYQNWWDSIRGQNGSLNAVRTDLTIPETYIYGTTYSNIVTQGDNGNGIEESPWNYVSKNGKVTRPAYGEKNVKGGIFLYLKYGSFQQSSSAAPEFTVLAYQGKMTANEPVLSEDARLCETAVDAALSADLTVEGEPGVVSYQWYLDTDDEPGGGTAIEGAVKSTCFLPEDLKKGTYYYYYEATAPDAEPVISPVKTVVIREIIHVKGISLDQNSLELAIGQEAVLHPSFTPADADFPTATWSVKRPDGDETDGDETDVIRLDDDGKVTGLHAGSATVIARADDGGFVARCAVVVKPFSLEEVATISGLEDSYVYTGEAITPEPLVMHGSKELTKGTDYSIDSYQNNVNAGSSSGGASLCISGNGDYDGSITVPFTIVPAPLTDTARFKITGIGESYDYTGEAVTPEPIVKDGEKVLLKDTDYSLSYEDNVNASPEGENTAVITVTGKGNYKGQRDFSFTIRKKENPMPPGPGTEDGEESSGGGNGGTDPAGGSKIKEPGSGGGEKNPSSGGEKTDPAAAKQYKTGEKIQDDKTGGVYRILSADPKDRTLSYEGPADRSVSTLTIPDKVTLADGYTYRVTEIKKRAFKGCKNLVCIRFLSKTPQKLKLKKGAFAGLRKKCKIKVPKKKLGRYRKILKKAGLSSKIKIIKG